MKVETNRNGEKMERHVRSRCKRADGSAANEIAESRWRIETMCKDRSEQSSYLMTLVGVYDSDSQEGALEVAKT